MRGGTRSDVSCHKWGSNAAHLRRVLHKLIIKLRAFGRVLVQGLAVDVERVGLRLQQLSQDAAVVRLHIVIAGRLNNKRE